LRKLDPVLVELLNANPPPDYVVISVGWWWESNHVGYIIDDKGKRWQLKGKYLNAPLIVDKEWSVKQPNITGTTTTADAARPNVAFAHLMERVVRMIQQVASPRTKIVWRTDNHNNCPVWKKYRSSFAPVLQEMNVSVLNISQASCDYVTKRRTEIDPNAEPHHSHLCAPSVAMRHWLLQFQEQFF
jgi:hypothetical protein